MIQKPRAEVAAFINNQLATDTKKGRSVCHHYGVLELRDLMDYLYGTTVVQPEEVVADPFYFKYNSLNFKRKL